MALWEFSVILVASVCLLVFFFGVFVGRGDTSFIALFCDISHSGQIVFEKNFETSNQRVFDRERDGGRLRSLNG